MSIKPFFTVSMDLPRWQALILTFSLTIRFKNRGDKAEDCYVVKVFASLVNHEFLF
jgi:hypothetical protein